MVALLLTSASTPRAQALPGRSGVIVFSITSDPPPVTVLDQFNEYDLFTLKPGSAAIQQLTSGPEADFHPAWSRDGTRIAFARSPQMNLAADIYVMGSDGSGAVNLTNTPTDIDVSPDWSPDGRRIVFGRADNEPIFTLLPLDLDLYMMNADGSDLTPLLVAPGGQGFPAWSPDGKWIAYSTGDPRGVITREASLRLISPDGEKHRTIAEIARPLYASWSPDSRWITFASGPPLESNDDIYVVRRDGTGLVNLTSSDGVVDSYPTWSPDGTQIAFMSDRSGTNRLYVMEADGDNVRPLVDLDLSAAFGTDWAERP